MNEIEAQIIYNQTLIAIVNVLAELTMSTSDSNSAHVIHMLESADNLSKINQRLIDKMKDIVARRVM